jgi:hypothetical protein
MDNRQNKISQNGYNNVNSNHPLIHNSQQYFIYKKYISIHSEDRDITKYPKSSSFEIELPEDYLNVYKMSLYSWNFPSNYNSFSNSSNNISMVFQINQPYNASENTPSNELQVAIFEALFYHVNQDFVITIEEGFYNPTQMTTELTNKFNQSVTDYITTYFTNNGYTDLIDTFANAGGYQEFVIVYNNVSQKIWFGNRSSGFILKNSEVSFINKAGATLDNCSSDYANSNKIPNYSNWGLPANLGLVRCDQASIQSANVNSARFYYGDVFPGDGGYWLLTDQNLLPGSNSYYVEPLYKINLMGPGEFYMELSGYNSIDTTVPFNLSKFTTHTNQTNSIVNGAFAKISVPCTPISQYYDKLSSPYKFFYPPAERIRKLSITLKYHDGTLVDFGNFVFSFMFEFELLIPQINRTVQPLNYTLI